jgi:hypothetical protein
MLPVMDVLPDPPTVKLILVDLTALLPIRLIVSASLLMRTALVTSVRVDEIVQASLQVDVWIRDPLLLVVKHFY